MPKTFIFDCLIKFSLFFCFTLTPCLAEAANWKKLNDNKHSKLLIDQQSVSKIDNPKKDHLKKAWVKIEHKTPQKNLESVDEKLYTSVKALWGFDCIAQKASTIQVYQYAQQELIYSAGVEAKNADYLEPVPESDMEIAMRHVCKASETAQPSAPAAKTESNKTEDNSTSAKTPPNSSPKTDDQSAAPVTPPATDEKSVPDATKKAPTPPASQKINGKTKPKTLASSPWSYEGKLGPDHWATMSPEFSLCASGKNQSPINIQATIHAALKPLRKIEKFPAKDIVNTGQSIQVNFKVGNMMALDSNAFQLKQIQFHAPSEHSINNISYPLEAQFMHTDNKGNWAILSVLYKEGVSNKGIEKLWGQLPKEIDTPVTLKARLTPKELMPDKIQYYRTQGSLTSPPCSEGVRWVIMKWPAEISKEQLKQYQDTIKQANNRPIQALNGRIVLE